jgi:tetratricopeptide (TPR) repeat protein
VLPALDGGFGGTDVLTPRSPLEAYRVDLQQAGSKEQFGREDASWLLVASGISRLASLGVAERVRAAAQLGASLLGYCREASANEAEYGSTAKVEPVARALESLTADAAAWDALVAAVRAIAEEAEGAGALMVANGMLLDVASAAEDATPREIGLILLQRGRIARTIGDLTLAEELYDRAEELGRQEGIPLLRARATLAKGLVLYARGNNPGARVLYERGLEEAVTAGLHDMIAHAHEALMIVTSKAGDLDAALAHGKAVLELISDVDRYASLLNNISRLAAEAGYPEAALRGHIWALSLTHAPRTRLPALAGAASNAARLEDWRMLEVVARVGEREVSDAYPYESARLWQMLWQAHLAAGAPHEAERCRKKARDLARAGGFFEIVYAVERGETGSGESVAAPPQPRALSLPSQAVVESLERFSTQEALSAGLTCTATGAGSHTPHLRG